MTNYKDQKKAFEELGQMLGEENFNIDKAIYKLTLRYEVSELSLRKRYKLMEKVFYNDKN